MAKRSKKTSKAAAKKKTKSSPPRPKSPAQLAVQAAGKITGDLICSLQAERKAFLRIGQLLTEVRDLKHYATLHHPDIEDYADKRLQLCRSSLYRFMKAYAWVLEHHQEWLEVPPKVRIPDLHAIEGLIWAEQELEKKDLSAGRKKTLADLKQKALDGKLRAKDLTAARGATNSKEEGTRRLISLTRALRKRYYKSADIRAQKALPLFDEILGIMESGQETAFLSILDTWVPRLHGTEFFSHNSMLT
jgi:hypothetical protein